MLDLMKFDSEISAAIITAFCGIMGILINIIVNYMYRRKDYRDKHKIHNIEIIEEFYVPLNNMLENLLGCVSRFEKFTLLFDAINASNDAENDRHRKQFKQIKEEILQHITECKQCYIGDYKLYLFQDILKKVLTQAENPGKEFSAITINEFKIYLEEHIKQINKRRVQIFSKNSFDYRFCTIKQRKIYKRLQTKK